MDSMQEQQLMQAMMQAEQNRRAEEEQKRREEELLRQQQEQRRQMEMQRQRQQQQQSQQQQGGMPSGGMNPMQFMGGGEAAGGATPAATSAAPAAEGGAAAGGGTAAGAGGTAGGSAAGSGGSALGSIGPWAALAAIIMANEKGGRDAGARDENKTHQARDAVTGRVVEQDFHQRWLPKWFGEDRGGGDYENDSTGFGADTHALADLTTFDPSNAWDTLRENGSARKLWDKLF